MCNLALKRCFTCKNLLHKRMYTVCTVLRANYCSCILMHIIYASILYTYSMFMPLLHLSSKWIINDSQLIWGVDLYCTYDTCSWKNDVWIQVFCPPDHKCFQVSYNFLTTRLWWSLELIIKRTYLLGEVWLWFWRTIIWVRKLYEMRCLTNTSALNTDWSQVN